MGRQVNLDTWQTQRLQELLQMGSEIVSKTDRSIILYRQTLEEEEGCYEEIVCTLTTGHIIEQIVTSGGMLVPSFRCQMIYAISDYPKVLLGQSKDRFREVTVRLEEQLGLHDDEDDEEENNKEKVNLKVTR